MRTYFDVTRTWLLWRGPPNTIARSVFGLCAAGEQLGIAPIVLHPLRATWYRVPRFTASSRVAKVRPWELWKRVHELETVGEPVDIAAGDVVHLLEPPFPAIPRYAAAINRLKRLHPPCHIVPLVHDLCPLEMPECSSRGARRMSRQWVTFLGRYGDRITVGSQAVADSVRRHVPGTPVHAVRLGSRIESSPFTAPTSADDIIRLLQSERGRLAPLTELIIRQGTWILAVGRPEPCANHALILDALEPLWSAGRLELPLVLAGRPSMGAGALRRRVRASPVLRRHVEFLGTVTDEVLWRVYRGAKLTIVPSLYDGSALQVSESLQCGCPCLASHAGGIPEVARGRVEYFDPTSCRELQSLILGVLEDPDRERDLRSRAQGFEAFTWTDTVTDMTGGTAPGPIARRTPPMDVVYTWCDDSDPEFRSTLSRWRTAHGRPEAAGGARFRTHDELRYSLRSLERHAPWVRNVYLVTDGQVPTWLARDNPDIHVVPHRDIFEDRTVLPCFNSLAIETNLHRIPNLSEWFLYLNDDMLLGRDVPRDAFFTSEARPVFFVESYPLPGPRAPWFPGRDEDLMKRCHRHNHRLLREKLAMTLDARDPVHTPQLYRRQVLMQLEQEWRREFELTRSCRFREPRNVKLAVLYPPFASESALVGTPHRLRTLINGSAEYILRTVRDRDIDELDTWLAEIERVRPTFFCVNDAVEDPVVAERLRARYGAMLQRCFPAPSRYERVVA